MFFHLAAINASSVTSGIVNSSVTSGIINSSSYFTAATINSTSVPVAAVNSYFWHH